MKSKLLRIATLFLASIGLAHASEKLNVVATFAPIFSLTKNVAGDCANVSMLLPPDIGPHDFAMSPRDLRKLAAADVIISNGLNLESWLEKAVQSGAKKEAAQIIASQGVKPIDTGDGEGPNPHIWLDPTLAIKMVENIRDGLATRDPACAETYKKNAAAYIGRLQKLDAEIHAETSTLKARRLISFHDSMPYFAARYDFEIIGVFEPFPGKEPTPKYLKHLRDTIREKKVQALFSEPQYSPQILRSVSEDLKVPIAVIDPMETGEPDAGLYEKVMRTNLRSLMSALHGS